MTNSGHVDCPGTLEEVVVKANRNDVIVAGVWYPSHTIEKIVAL